MKIFVSTADLKKAVNQVMPAVPDKSKTPILSCVLIKADSNGAIIEGTDFSTAAAVKIFTDAEEAGKVAVPAKHIQDIVSHLAGKTTKITTTKGEVEFSTDEIKYSLYSADADEFPETKFEEEYWAEISLSAKDFKRLVKQTTFAAIGKAEDTRPIFKGVSFKINREKITAVATNTHRMAAVTLKEDFQIINLAEDDREVIIPAKILDTAARFVPNEGTVALKISKNSCLIEYDNFKLKCRTIDGNFPDWEKVLKVDIGCTATVDRAEFVAALERANIVARITEFNTIILDVAGDSMKISADSYDLGRSSETISATVENGSIKIGFNVDYLLEFAKRADSAEIIFKFGQDAISPALINVPFDEDYKYLVTPIRTQAD